MTQKLRSQVGRLGLALDQVGEADHVLLRGVGLGRETSVAPLRDPALASALRSVRHDPVSAAVRVKPFPAALRQDPVFGRLEKQENPVSKLEKQVSEQKQQVLLDHW